jgi:hypothetical protein
MNWPVACTPTSAMTRPNYDLLIPALFVGVILPVVAGRWFHYEYPDALKIVELPMTVQADAAVEPPTAFASNGPQKNKTISSRSSASRKASLQDQLMPAVAIEKALSAVGMYDDDSAN